MQISLVFISKIAILKIGWILHLTADKREIKDFPKLPLATSFIRKTLSEIGSKDLF
jgi:hypothetical protein